MTSSDFTPFEIATFWSNIEITDLLSCWLWKKATDNDGYGRTSHKVDSKHKHMRAHRIAYILHNGYLDNNLHVLHTCDNPPCCNPAHLFTGTQLDNNADMMAKGRHAYGDRVTARRRTPKGELHHHTQLTNSQVVEIKKLINKKEKFKKGELKTIGNKFGVSSITISHIAHGRTWKHL